VVKLASRQNHARGTRRRRSLVRPLSLSGNFAKNVLTLLKIARQFLYCIALRLVDIPKEISGLSDCQSNRREKTQKITASVNFSTTDT
jgi:hypothetical protein